MLYNSYMEAVELSNWPNKVLVASPRGFCAGVVRAIDTLKAVQVANPNQTTYAFHEIIHNNHVVKEFEESGVRFVNTVEEVPEGSALVFSAHGVSPEVKNIAAQRRLRTVDSTCPLVYKTHMEARRFLQEGMTVLYIGHANHDETVGTLGYAPQIKLVEKVEDLENLEIEDTEKVALISQTTLSVDDTAKIRAEILKRFPGTRQPKKTDICFATQNRQDGVKAMIGQGAEAIVVLGSPTSSNSTRLREVAGSYGAKAFFVDEAKLLVPNDFMSFRCVGLTSGASAPEDKFREIEEFFRLGGTSVFEEVKVASEDFGFELPRELL